MGKCICQYLHKLRTFIAPRKKFTISRMSCSFFNKSSPCGPAPRQNDPMIVPAKSCDHDLHSHLASLGISGRTPGGSQTSQISEADVIFNRAGFIAPSRKQMDEFTVCPRHRYLLTYGWSGRKRLTCFHPNHLGKRSKQKNVRRINLEMSRSIYFLENQQVPVGAGKKKSFLL